MPRELGRRTFMGGAAATAATAGPPARAGTTSA